MSGWVAIKRGLFEHEFFAREPMSEREAWVWMITRAAWKNTRHRVGQDMVDVPRGAFMATLRELQAAWGWGSDMRVRTFLKRLEIERMATCEIVARNNARKTQITLCNYEDYQAIERTENASNNATETQPVTHKKNKEQQTTEQEKKEVGLSPPKCRLPEDWTLSDEGWEYARSQKIPDEVIRDEIKGFHAYWTDRRDRDATKSARGWEQCWANRCRQIAPKYARGGLAGGTLPFRGGQSPSIASIVAQRRAGGIV